MKTMRYLLFIFCGSIFAMELPAGRQCVPDCLDKTFLAREGSLRRTFSGNGLYSPVKKNKRFKQKMFDAHFTAQMFMMRARMVSARRELEKKVAMEGLEK